MSEVRLIDANALLKSLKSGCENCSDANTNWCEHCCKINDFEDLIDNAPTIEVTDYDTGYQDGLEDGLNDIRPKGKWKHIVEEDNDVECPFCGFQEDGIYSNFCPKCGADMRV